jgi:DNA replication protein DnaC
MDTTATTPATLPSPDPSDLTLIREFLRHAGVATVGLSESQVRAAYHDFAIKRDADANTVREEESRSHGERLVAALEKQEQHRQRDRIERAAAFLKRNGVDPTGLSGEDVIARATAASNAAQERDRVAREQERARALFEAAECPEHHVKNMQLVRPADNPRWKRIHDFMVSQLDSTFVATLYGPRGPGKTQIGVHLICAATQRGIRARYVRRASMGLNVRDSYDRKGWTEKQWVEHYASVEFLVIDEFHQTAASAFNLDLINLVVDLRYGDDRATLIIANVAARERDKAKKELGELLGGTITSRMNGEGGAILCDWPSYRVPKDGWAEFTA